MKTSQQEYFEELKNLQDGTIKNLTKVPSDEPRFVIDSNTRKITVPNEFKFLAVKNDANAEKIYFEIDRYFDSEDLSNHTIAVQYSDASTLCDDNAIVGIDAVTDIDLTTEPGKILFRWTIKHEVTFKATDIAFAIRFYTVGDDNKFTYSFNTVSVCLPVLDTLDTTNDAIQRYANILDEWLEKMGNIESSIDSKISGMKTDIEILKYEAHTHQNKAVIDKLSESDYGKLLFDGNVICDGASREYVDTELEKKVNNSDFDIAKNDIQENKSSISKLKEDMGNVQSDVNNVRNDVNSVKVGKISNPTNADNGKIARAKDGGIEWVDVGQPTDQQTEVAVNGWLDKHPEATTTVQDYSLTWTKFKNGVIPYVTPEMFGAVGDGIHDDTLAFQTAIEYAHNNNIGEVICGNSSIYLVTPQKNILGDEDGDDYVIDDYHLYRPGTESFKYCIAVDKNVALNLNNSSVKTLYDASTFLLCGGGTIKNGVVYAGGDINYKSPIILLHGGSGYYGNEYYEEYHATTKTNLENLKIIDCTSTSYSSPDAVSYRAGLLLYTGGKHKSNHIQFVTAKNLTISNCAYGIRIYSSNKNHNGQGYFNTFNTFNSIIVNNFRIAICLEGKGSSVASNHFTEIISEFQMHNAFKKVAVYISDSIYNYIRLSHVDAGSTSKTAILDNNARYNVIETPTNISSFENNTLDDTNVFTSLDSFKKTFGEDLHSFNILSTTSSIVDYSIAGLQNMNLIYSLKELNAVCVSALGKEYDYSNLFNPYINHSELLSGGDTVTITFTPPHYFWRAISVCWTAPYARNVTIQIKPKGTDDSEYVTMLNKTVDKGILDSILIPYGNTYRQVTIKITIFVKNNSYMPTIMGYAAYIPALSNGMWMPRLLKSPNGTFFTLSVSDDGILTAKKKDWN